MWGEVVGLGNGGTGARGEVRRLSLLSASLALVRPRRLENVGAHVARRGKLTLLALCAQLSLHRGPSVITPSPSPPHWSVDAPRSGARALQYKLDEGGAVWEVKGQMGGRVW